jgi:hypothetical protein
MSHSYDDLMKIEEIIRKLESNLIIAQPTLPRFLRHINLIEESLDVLNQVAGSNSSEVACPPIVGP